MHIPIRFPEVEVIKQSLCFNNGDTVLVAIGKENGSVSTKLGGLSLQGLPRESRMYYPVGYRIIADESGSHELIGVSKGACQLLQERGIPYDCNPNSTTHSITCKQRKFVSDSATDRKKAKERYDMSRRAGGTERQLVEAIVLKDAAKANLDNVVRQRQTYMSQARKDRGLNVVLDDAEKNRLEIEKKEWDVLWNEAKTNMKKTENEVQAMIPPTTEEKQLATIALLTLPDQPTVAYSAGCIECN